MTMTEIMQGICDACNARLLQKSLDLGNTVRFTALRIDQIDYRTAQFVVTCDDGTNFGVEFDFLEAIVASGRLAEINCGRAN